MKLDFKFANLCGTVYKRGNLLFHKDFLYSPVGNRVTCFDLVKNTSFTFPIENNKDIVQMAISPNGLLLVTVDEDGRCLFINVQKKVVLHHFSFKESVKTLSFSPDGKFLAVSQGRKIQLWKTPSLHSIEFSPLTLEREYLGHYDAVTCLSWSSDSLLFVSGSKDMTCRVYMIHEEDREKHEFKGAVLTGHSDAVVGVWLSSDNQHAFSVSKDGSLFTWDLSFSSDKRQKLGKIERWKTLSRHYFNQHAKVVSAAFHPQTNLLSVGFDSGVFGIWEAFPEFNHVQSLSISQKKINAVTMHPSGEWLAFGCSTLGQLLVWEWQSESYVLKQQGHQHNMTCLDYSPDGQFIATGGGDGKLKIWNTQSGFCFVTFYEHVAGISSLQFGKKGQVVFTCSLDGTCRAFDLIRYRNFKTFTSPRPVQFSCIAVDASGEIVCAGSQDSYEIFVWSVQTGRLLDILSGHEGPVSSLAFSMDGLLFSSSWDHTVRVWDLFSRDKSVDSLNGTSEILALAYRPDGKQVATCNLKGQICLWNMEGILVSTIDINKDITAGRKKKDVITSATSSKSLSFSSLCYSADGKFIIGGGNSRYVCIYQISTGTMVKKFTISNNMSLDGMKQFLNSKNMTDAGPMDLIDASGEASDLEDRMDVSLPGVKDPSLRNTRPEIRTCSIRFSPSGRSWAAATTEGLLIFSLDEPIHFDPFELDIDITPDSIQSTLKAQEYTKALVMAFRLGETQIISMVYNSIPHQHISLVIRSLPSMYLERFIKNLISQFENSKRLGFHLNWTVELLTFHGRFIKEHSLQHHASLKGLFKCLSRVKNEIGTLCSETGFALDYLVHQQQFNPLTVEMMLE